MLTEELVTIWRFKSRDAALTRAQKGVDMMRSSLAKLAIATAAAGAGLAYVLRAAGTREQVQITLDVLTGSAEKGKKLLEDLVAFADKTPFQTKHVVDYGKTLLGVGFEAEKVTGIIKTLGDAAAGTGMDKMPRFISALATMRSVGKVDFEFLRRFLEAGLPLLEEMGKFYGKTKSQVKKMVSAGKIGVKDVLASIKRMTTGTGKYAGLMEKQSKSLFGLWSTIMGKFDNLIKEAGQKFLPVWKNLMKEYIKWFEANRDLLRLGLIEFFESLSNTVRVGVATLYRFWKATNKVVNLIGGWKVVLIAMAALLGGTFLTGLGLAITGLWGYATAASAAAGATFTATLAALGFKLVVGAIPLLIGAVALALVGLVDDFLVWKAGGEAALSSVYNWFGKLWERIVGIKNEFAAWIKSIRAVQKILGWIGKARSVTEDWGVIKDFEHRMNQKDPNWGTRFRPGG